MLLSEWFIAGGEKEIVFKVVVFFCFSNTELVVLGGFNGGVFNQLVEKYNIQTGDCMPFLFSLLF